MLWVREGGRRPYTQKLLHIYECWLEKPHKVSESGVFVAGLLLSRQTGEVESVFNQESGGTCRSKAGKVDSRKSVWKYCC